MVKFLLLLCCTLLSSTALSQETIDETLCVCGNGIQEIFPQSVAPCPYKLYGVTAAGPTGISNLLYLNPYDGTGSIIAPISNTIRAVNGLDFSPTGDLYAVGRNPEGTQPLLATINCTTGEATIIDSITAPQPAITGLNFDSQGRLWAHVTGTPVLIRQDGILGQINRVTGAFTFIGNTLRNGIGNGIGFGNFPNSILYHADNVDLNILSQTTGEATLIDPLLFTEPAHNRPRINDMDFDPFTNIMYVSINDRGSGTGSPNEDYLGTINLTNGDVSFVKLPPNLAPAGLAALSINRAYETCDQGGIPENDPPLPDGCTCSANCALVENDCQDLVDNDFDGLSDCKDPDCSAQTCEDGNLCTVGDVCSGTTCVTGVLKDCDDLNDCTDDSCADGACIHAINITNPCSDLNDCTSDSCDIDGKCLGTNLPNGTSCDNGDACITNDQCLDGSCENSPVPEICDNGDDDDCDGDVDLEDSDCQPPPENEDICDDGIDNDNDGDFDCADSDCNMLPCADDGNSCTDDVCSGLTCTHPTDDSNACTDANPCTDDECISGSCLGTNDDTNICDDLDACTTSDQCLSGACGGTPIICDDSQECTTDFCFNGNCSFSPLTGPACTTDANSCTNDVCVNGVCTHTNNTNACSDNLACTSDDSCSGGTCIGTPGIEICTNAIDDDCDFLIDSEDPNCSALWLNVFITSATFPATFGLAATTDDESIMAAHDVADALCQSAAVNASRPGTYVAFLSTATSNVSTRIINPNNRPWYLFTGAPNRIAKTKASLLSGAIEQAINVTEFGLNVASPKFAWTGSTTNGTYNGISCNNWTTTNSNVKGTRGAADKVDDQWVSQPDATCNLSFRLYCFQIDTGL